MTRETKLAIAKMQARVLDWKTRFLGLQGISEQATKNAINEWLDECEQVYAGSMSGVVSYSGLDGARKVGRVIGESYTLEAFKDAYAEQLRMLSTKDLTKATMLRNSLASRLIQNNNWQAVYKEYDNFVKTSLGKSLYQIKQEFMDRAVFEEVIAFNDSIGRLWRPERYAEMWARTRSGEISSEITTEVMGDNDLDVIQISDHNTTTPICMQYEGRYFSVFGKTPGLPPYDVKAPYHPNCLHTEIVIPMENINKKINTNKMLDRKTPAASPAEQDYISKQEEWNIANRS